MSSAGDRVSAGGRAGDAAPVPTREDPVAVAASEVAGGPLGRYAVAGARGWRYYAGALAAASALPVALGVTMRAHCIDSGWSTPDQFWHACFSDIPATYKDQGLTAGFWALLTGAAGGPTPVQPPLTSLVMTLLASLVPAAPMEDQSRFYFGLWAVLGAVLIALTTWWTAATTPRLPWNAAHVALSPVVALTLVVAPDVLGLVLTAAGMYLWSRQRLVASGVLLGLAVSARSYPVVILLAIMLLAVRSGRVRAAALTVAAAAGAFAAVLLVLVVANPAAAWLPYQSWARSGPGFGTPWLLPQLAGYTVPNAIVTAMCVMGWVAALLTGAALALGARRRPTVAEVALVMLVVVMVTGKSVPVQSSLWLVPLVALVGLRWKDHLLWAGAEALHFIAVWLYFATSVTPDRGLPAGWYGFFLLLRVAAMGWLARRTWQVAWDRAPAPEDDTTADPPDADPDGADGVLSGRPDALVVRFS